MIKMLFPNSRYCRLFSDPNMDFGPSQADFRIAPVDDLDQVFAIVERPGRNGKRIQFQRNLRER